MHQEDRGEGDRSSRHWYDLDRLEGPGVGLQCHRAVPRLSSRGTDRAPGAGPSLASVLRLILRFLAPPGLLAIP